MRAPEPSRRTKLQHGLNTKEMTMIELFARWGHNVLLVAVAIMSVAVLVAAR
jgi:hypothetical protein